VFAGAEKEKPAVSVVKVLVLFFRLAWRKPEFLSKYFGNQKFPVWNRPKWWKLTDSVLREQKCFPRMGGCGKENYK